MLLRPIQGLEFGIGRRTNDQVGKGMWVTDRALSRFVAFCLGNGA